MMIDDMYPGWEGDWEKGFYMSDDEYKEMNRPYDPMEEEDGFNNYEGDE